VVGFADHAVIRDGSDTVLGLAAVNYHRVG
jgi:hypothetical protein